MGESRRLDLLWWHLRWAAASGTTGGLLLALALLAHVAVRSPWLLDRGAGLAVTVAGVAGASCLVGLLVAGTAGALLLAFDLRRRQDTDARGAPVYRWIVPALPVCWTFVAWVQFGWFEGRLDAGSFGAVLGALLCGAGIALAASAALRRAWPPRRAPSAAWPGIAILAVLLTLLPVPGTGEPRVGGGAVPVAGTTQDSRREGAPGPHARTGVEGAPTVILITVDTLRADHTGLHGYARDTTPNLDLLAAEGVVVERMIAATSCTVPSTAAIVTGLDPWCSGVRNQWQPVVEGVETMAERFRAHGYRTLAVVANPLLYSGNGFDQGFDAFDNLGTGGPPYPDASTMSAAALELLPQSGEPAFLWIHYMDPHYPYLPAESEYEPFLADDLYRDDPLPFIRYGSRGGVRADRILLDDRSGGTIASGTITARYDGEIRTLDAGIGELLKGLRERGRASGAVLAFTADHGESLTEHGQRYDHCQETYDSTVHVPALFLGADEGLRGRRVQGVASHLDVLPTLLALAGLPRAELEELPGRNLLADGPPDLSRRVFTRSGLWDGLTTALLGRDRLRPVRAIVEDGWKYVSYPDHELALVRGPRSLVHAWRACIGGFWKRDELFDLEDDPSEIDNRTADLPGRARRMREALESYPTPSDLAGCPWIQPGETADPSFEERLRSLGYIR